MAAGILGLVLEANPKLTWRDIQHLIVNSSDVTSLKNDNFQKNGAGHNVSDHLGYGLLKTERLIETAKNWVNVRPQRKCRQPSTTVRRQIHVREPNRTVSSSFNTDACNATYYEVLFLEHVQVYIKYQYSKRGAVIFYLISPSGTKSKILTRRSMDTKANGEQEWTFMSVQYWDENPLGNWTLQMSLEMDWGEIGELTEWYLTFFGTTIMDHYSNTTMKPTDNSPSTYSTILSTRTTVVGGTTQTSPTKPDKCPYVVIIVLSVVGVALLISVGLCYRHSKNISAQLKVCCRCCKKNYNQTHEMQTNSHYQNTKNNK